MRRKVAIVRTGMTPKSINLSKTPILFINKKSSYISESSVALYGQYEAQNVRNATSVTYRSKQTDN